MENDVGKKSDDLLEGAPAEKPAPKAKAKTAAEPAAEPKKPGRRTSEPTLLFRKDLIGVLKRTKTKSMTNVELTAKMVEKYPSATTASVQRHAELLVKQGELKSELLPGRRRVFSLVAAA